MNTIIALLFGFFIVTASLASDSPTPLDEGTGRFILVYEEPTHEVIKPQKRI